MTKVCNILTSHVSVYVTAPNVTANVIYNNVKNVKVNLRPSQCHCEEAKNTVRIARFRFVVATLSPDSTWKVMVNSSNCSYKI